MPENPIRWENNTLIIIDQTKLPEELEYIPLNTVREVWDAIKQLKVRGAPAIGISAAWGVLAGLRENPPADTAAALRQAQETAEYLATSRPTAVNLFWALERMKKAAQAAADADSADTFFERLEEEARAIHEEEIASCRAIGEYGKELIKENTGVITHCNAGGLATGRYGTALAPMFLAHEEGRSFQVFVDETRPLLQGSRLTAWELRQAGIDATLICDNMAACVMGQGRIQLAITGADRIAANGDTANKIGTRGLAMLCAPHEIPFYIAAPSSTFDMSLKTGAGIPIEERDPDEIRRGFGKLTAPADITVYNPAFDVTPAEYITGIITEKGILRPPYTGSIAGLFNG
jgi:methylthioribose-1-phosphate isomerase